jgi:hypothetical protein
LWEEKAHRHGQARAAVALLILVLVLVTLHGGGSGSGGDATASGRDRSEGSGDVFAAAAALRGGLRLSLRRRRRRRRRREFPARQLLLARLLLLHLDHQVAEDLAQLLHRSLQFPLASLRVLAQRPQLCGQLLAALFHAGLRLHHALQLLALAGGGIGLGLPRFLHAAELLAQCRDLLVPLRQLLS